MNETANRPISVLALAAGFTAWAIAFVVLYGSQALGCRLGWQHTELLAGMSLQRLVLVASFLVLLAATALLALALHRCHHRIMANDPPARSVFLGRVARDAGIAAVGAVVFCLVWVFWLAAC